MTTHEMTTTRLRHARDLIEEVSPYDHIGDDAETLVHSKYACVIRSEGQAWCFGADNYEDIGNLIISTYTTDGIESEYLDCIINLDTGSEIQIPYKITMTVVVGDETISSSW